MLCSNYIAMVEYNAETGIIRDMRTNEIIEDLNSPLWKGMPWVECYELYEKIVRNRLKKIPLNMGGTKGKLHLS